MKKDLIILIFVVIVLYQVPANGQIGWQFGTSTVNYSFDLVPGSSDVISSAIDNYGNIYATAGAIYDSLKFGSLTVYPPCGVLTKLDTSGNFLWTLVMQGNNSPDEIALDPAGNIYMVGFYQGTTFNIGSITLSNTTGSMDMYFISKIAPSGTVLWAKNIAGNNFYYTGQVPKGLGIDAAGNAYISATLMGNSAVIGSTTVTNDNLSSPTHEALEIKYNESGTLLWVKKIGINTDPAAMLVSATGDQYLSGNSHTDSLHLGTVNLHDSVTNFNYFIKLDSAGNCNWAKIIPVSAITMAFSRKTDGSEEGYIYFSGTCLGTQVIGPDTIIISGSASNSFLAKYDTSGNGIWAKAFNSSVQFTPQVLSADYCGHIFIGSGSGGGLGSPVPPISVQGHTLSFPTISSDDLYIIELDSSGIYQNGLTLGSGGDDYFGVHPDTKGNFYFVGDFEDATIGLGPDTIHAISETFAFGKYRYQTGSCGMLPITLESESPQTANSEILIYPNPLVNEFTITSEKAFITGARAEISDITGKRLFSYSLIGSHTNIYVGNLAAGIYYCRIIEDENKISVKKLVIIK